MLNKEKPVHRTGFLFVWALCCFVRYTAAARIFKDAKKEQAFVRRQRHVLYVYGLQKKIF